MQSISVQDLHRQLKIFSLIDVREQWEWDIGHIHKSIHIPLKDLILKNRALDRNCPIAVICHHGVRSAKAVDALLQYGFLNVYNVKGGIEAWSREIDPTVPLY